MLAGFGPSEKINEKREIIIFAPLRPLLRLSKSGLISGVVLMLNIEYGRC